MSSPLILPLVDEGLGNSAYLVDLVDGRALAVDPSRDLRALRNAAAKHGLTVAFSAETHLHADFLTGSVQLAADHDVEVLGATADGRGFRHQGLAEGDEVDLGGLTLRALATPGHTPGHLSYLLLEGSQQLAVFTGGSLIVGAAARTDLSGEDRTEELARAQYRSLHRLVDELSDDTLVLPTHGAGSFCSAPPGTARTSTVGEQRRTNPLLAASDEDAFVRQLLDSLGSYPSYFDRLSEVNRRGPQLVHEPILTPLANADVVRLRESGAQVVDVRPLDDFAAAHIPGALSIELRGAFGTWLGWLTDPARPVVVVRNPEQDPEEILWQALKVGCDQLVGELTGGLAAWQAAGGQTHSMPVIDAAQADPARLLDIRQRGEFAAGHVPGARHAELATLGGTRVHEARVREAFDGPVQTACGHGERAATAASLLAAAGRQDVTIVRGSPGDWATANGIALEVGL